MNAEGFRRGRGRIRRGKKSHYPVDMRLPLHSPRSPLTENHTTVTGAPAVGFGLAVTDTTDSEGQRQAKRRGRQRGGDSSEEDENFFPSNEFQGAVPGFVYKKGDKGLGYYSDPTQRGDERGTLTSSFSAKFPNLAKGGDGPSAKECPTVDWRGIFGDRKPPKSHVEAVGPPVEEDPDLGDMSDGVLEVMNKLELDSDRVFQCSDIIVRRGGVLSVKPWDGKTGGVLRMRARGTVTIEEGGKIDVSNCGYRGFPAVFNNMEGQSTQGESYSGQGNTAKDSNESGGGGGLCSSSYGSAGGGGGGHGSEGEKAHDNKHGGNTHPGGTGGVVSPGGPEMSAGLLMGSGGGSGSFYSTNPANHNGEVTLSGGNGGGAVEIVAPKIVIRGSICADGGNGDNGARVQYASGGGGGSGGSILLRAFEIVFDSGKLNAKGGKGGDCNKTSNIASTGGNGGGGRIRLDVDTLSGHGAVKLVAEHVQSKFAASAKSKLHQNEDGCTLFVQESPPGLTLGVSQVRDAVRARDLPALRQALEGLPAEIPSSFSVECADARALLDRLEEEAHFEGTIREALRAGYLPHLRVVMADTAEHFKAAPPPEGSPLELAMVEGELMVNERTTWVDSLLAERLGPEKVKPLISSLTDAEYVALLPVVTGANSDQCTCQTRHELPLTALNVVQQLDHTLKVCTSTAINDFDHAEDDVANYKVRKPLLTSELKECRVETKSAQAEFDAAKERLERAVAAREKISRDYDNYDAELERQRKYAKNMKVRCVAVDSLEALSQSVCADSVSAVLKWRKWEDALGATNAILNLADDQMDFLLITLGRCDWCPVFAKHGLTPNIVAGVTDDMMLKVLGDAPGCQFGRIREFVLAIQALEAGNGLLPSCSSDETGDLPLDLWSTERVAKHFERVNLPEAAKRCRELVISGRVLNSITRDDIFRHVALPGGLEAALDFEAAIAEVRPPPSTEPSESSSSDDSDERLSTAVSNALSEGSPTRLPMNYIRRCTHGFDDSRTLGLGAFSRVYRAVDPVSGLRFAVKRAWADEDGGDLARQQAEDSMMQELEILKALRHPNVIRAIGFCLPDTNDSHACLAFELGTLGSVADTLKDNTAAALFGVTLRVQALRALASVLHYMHNCAPRPIFHRDIKSANLVLTEDMTVKLIDFGHSVFLSDDQIQEKSQGNSAFTKVNIGGGGIQGTPGYLCPRYIVTGKFGESSEVFSFGVVMMEFLTGKVSEAVEGGLYSFYIDPVNQEEELTPDVVDKRAGEWPSDWISEVIRLTKQCTGNFKRRPGVETVLADLSQLVPLKDSTADPLYRRMKTTLDQVEKENATLIITKQEEKSALEKQALSTTTRTPQTPNRECCVCFDVHPPSNGVECGATRDDAVGSAPHFTCLACFSKHVQTECEKGVHDRMLREGQVFCPLAKHGCPCTDPFPESQIAIAVPAAFNIFREAQSALQRDLLNVAFDKRLKAERDRLFKMAEEEKEIERARHTIVDSILTLKCPRCDTAFMDFDGCYALICHRCSCGFCAFCLADCGTDAHAHVASCKFNKPSGGYGNGPQEFNEAQKKRRERMVTEFLKTLDAGVRTKVLAACEKNLEELELDLNSISGDSGTTSGIAKRGAPKKEKTGRKIGKR